MRTLVCRYATPAGAIQTEERQAEDIASLRQALEQQGCYVFTITPASTLRLFRLGPLVRLPALRRRVAPGDLLIVTQELHALVRAGLPIVQGLDVLLRRCTQGRLRDALAAVREDVKGGRSLSEAAARHPRVFSPLYVASLRAGEQSGALVDCLARYLALLKRMLAVRSRVLAALVYPAILLVLSVVVVGFLLAYVVPTFSQVYTGLKATLPAPTLLLVHATALLARYAFPLAALAALGVVSFVSWARTPAGRRRLDGLLLALPWVGEVVTRYAASVFCRTLATLLGGGIPIVPSLETAADAVGNRVVRERFRAQIPALEAGRPLAAALEGTGALPPTAVEMLAVGESTGALEEMLGHVADFFDEELDLKLQALTAAVEPLLMVGMGLFVGTIIVIMYLPIFDLAGALR